MSVPLFALASFVLCPSSDNLRQMAFAGCPADVLHDPLRRRFSVYGFLSHLHSLMVTMSQKSSATQAAKSVSQALMPDSPPGRRNCQVLIYINGSITSGAP
jgi:hypothetical protein